MLSRIFIGYNFELYSLVILTYYKVSFLFTLGVPELVDIHRIIYLFFFNKISG